MAQVKKGDRVRIIYSGTLQDGTVFDSTHESGGCSSDACGCAEGPRELIVGDGEFLPRIEEELIGMAPGEKKTVIIPAEDALGEYDEENVFAIPRSDLPEDLKPEVGDQIVLINQDNEELPVTVVEVGEENVTFDSNHPLAGEDLTFEIEVVEIL